MTRVIAAFAAQPVALGIAALSPDNWERVIIAVVGSLPATIAAISVAVNSWRNRRSLTDLNTMNVEQLRHLHELVGRKLSKPTTPEQNDVRKEG